MKTIYLYNPETGEFIGSQPARESPKEKGIYLIPAYATDIEPPTVRAKQVAVFSGGGWLVQPDYRGIYWDGAGNQVSIDKIGTLPDASYSATPPKKQLADVRADRKKYVSANGKSKLFDGITSSATGKALLYPMDGPLINAFLLTLAQAGAKQKKGEPYKVFCLDAATGVPVMAAHTLEQLQAVSDQIIASNADIFSRIITKFSAIDSASSEAEINGIEW